MFLNSSLEHYLPLIKQCKKEGEEKEERIAIFYNVKHTYYNLTKLPTESGAAVDSVDFLLLDTVYNPG